MSNPKVRPLPVAERLMKAYKTFLGADTSADISEAQRAYGAQSTTDRAFHTLNLRYGALDVGVRLVRALERGVRAVERIADLLDREPEADDEPGEDATEHSAANQAPPPSHLTLVPKQTEDELPDEPDGEPNDDETEESEEEEEEDHDG